MKFILVLSALVSLTIAGPTYEYIGNGGIKRPGPSYYQRYKKSTSPELSSDALSTAAPVHEIAAPVHEDAALAEKNALPAEKVVALAEKDVALADKDAAPIHKDSALAHEEALTNEGELSEGRTFKLIKKLKNPPHIHHHHHTAPGHHFRDDEEVQTDAKDAIDYSSDDELDKKTSTDDNQNKKTSTDDNQNRKTPTDDNQDKKIPIPFEQHRDLEKNIHIAKEAVDSIKNNFEEISKSSPGNVDWKNSESDKTFKHGIQTAKDALDLVHKSFHDFENIESKDAMTSSSNDAPIQMVKMTEERNEQWKESQDVQAKSADPLKTLETVLEEKPKEAEDLTTADQEGHMSQRVEVVQKPEAFIAPAISEHQQKSAIAPSPIIENEKILNLAKSNSDLQMKSADVTAPVTQNSNNLNVPLQNTESKTKFAQPKSKFMDTSEQQIPKGRINEHNHPQLHTEKLVEPKTTTQNLFAAAMDSKPAPKASMNIPQTVHKSEGEHQMHDFKHHNYPQARGAYNIGGAGAPGHGGAVGVFPNANIGGCAIPLLLSCNPSVIPGSLSKYPSGGSGYGAPAYRTNMDARMIEKRNTKKQPSTTEVKHTSILSKY